jgi:hypothetical protein
MFMNSKNLLVFVIVLQVCVLLTLWLGTPVSTARAQIPDAGAQQLEIINQLKAGNDKLDKMIGLLESGKLQIIVAKPDDQQKQ